MTPVPLPARLLDEGEQVVLDVRPHPWSLAGPLVVAVAAVALAGAGAAVAVPTAASWLLVALVALALVRLLSRWARWRSTSLVVTTERIVRRSGILVRRGTEIPLGQLADLSYRQGLVGRLVGAGDLVIESAGRDGREIVPDVPHPRAVQEEISAVIASREGGRPGASSLPDQIERLAELRRRGVLTPAEFEAGKARLLRQQ